LQPKYLPMLMPPRKWEYNPFVGGYYGRKHNYENKAEDVKEIK
jgi:DNA-directed RNA polymerase